MKPQRWLSPCLKKENAGTKRQSKEQTWYDIPKKCQQSTWRFYSKSCHSAFRILSTLIVIRTQVDTDTLYWTNLFGVTIIGVCWLTPTDVLAFPHLSSECFGSLNHVIDERVWTVSKVDQKTHTCSQNSTAIMLNLSTCFYCRTENPSPVLSDNEKKSFERIPLCVPCTIKCFRFEQSPTWLVSSRAELSQRRSVNRGAKRTSQSRQLKDRRDVFPFGLRPPSFLPFFILSFLSSLCLSVLSLSPFILLLPVIRALWSGPRRRIRVGPAGSLTWGAPGTSN